MRQVLVVEDDRDLSEGLCLALKDAETHTTQCYTLANAREALVGNTVDLVILDINLPDGSGLELLREIKRETNVPVIMLTANDTEMDVVLGLESGADDYITKPFSLAILRARVNAQLRRGQDASRPVAVDEYAFDFGRMEFTHRGRAVELSKTEQKLLRLLVENRGVTMTRGILMARVWPDGAEFVDVNTLSVAIKRLRDKLSAADYIKTVYGLGYTWVVR